MRIYLVRHAQTAWNLEGRAQGSTDIHLDETGHEQAQKLAVRFQQIPSCSVYSSDMSRCVETAEAIASVWDAQIDQRRDLRERAMGEWEGMLFRDLRRKLLDSRTIDDPFGLKFQPPGGESISEIAKRVKPILDEILEAKLDAVIVSHGGALSVILAQLVGQEIASARSFKFSNASVTELARNDWNVFVIESYNCLAHMSDIKSLQGSFDGSNR